MEEWRPVVEDAGYEVSSSGRVRSLLSCRGQQGRILKLKRSPGARYATVALRGKHIRNVHALVAEAFIGPRPPGQDVRHLDGDSLNNARENLAYGTHSENMKDAVRHGTLGTPAHLEQLRAASLLGAAAMKRKALCHR